MPWFLANTGSGNYYLRSVITQLADFSLPWATPLVFSLCRSGSLTAELNQRQTRGFTQHTKFYSLVSNRSTALVIITEGGTPSGCSRWQRG